MNYAAPLHVYGELSSSLAALPPNAPPAVICVGKEWYRFPSSFFLPEERFVLAFIHDGPVRAKRAHAFFCFAAARRLTDCVCAVSVLRLCRVCVHHA